MTNCQKEGKVLRTKRISLYILNQTAKLLTLLIAISILSFMLVSYSPIDPIRAYIGGDMLRVSPEQRANIEEYWGMNEPRPSQYLNWANSILHGDLGTSVLYRSPVAEVIAERFVASLALMATSWLLSGIFGFILGIIAGMKEGTWIDRLIKGYCFVLSATPTFWLGLVVVIVFSVWLGWFPIGLGTPAGMLEQDVSLLDYLKHLFLPALTLSIVGVANIALHTRTKLIETLNSEFIWFAKAKGEKGLKLLWRHGLRNISLPAISLQFASFGELFGGAVLTEQVFSYPGLGQAIVQAGLGGDVPLLLGIVLFSTIFVYVGNLMADVLYKVIDPRIRKEWI